jgi:hypothetical protein
MYNKSNINGALNESGVTRITICYLNDCEIHFVYSIIAIDLFQIEAQVLVIFYVKHRNFSR